MWPIKVKYIGEGAFNITKDKFYILETIDGRHLKEPTDLIHKKREIRTCNREILKSTNNRSK